MCIVFFTFLSLSLSERLVDAGHTLQAWVLTFPKVRFRLSLSKPAVDAPFFLMFHLWEQAFFLK
jgi:hypothetical protein